MRYFWRFLTGLRNRPFRGDSLGLPGSTKLSTLKVSDRPIATFFKHGVCKAWRGNVLTLGILAPILVLLGDFLRLPMI
eukprot:gene26397-biopygen16273